MLQLIIKLLKFRLIQLTQELKGIGLFYNIVVLFSLIFLTYFTYLKCQTFDGSWKGLTVFGIILFYIHYIRNDHQFLDILTDNSWLIISIEYIILSLPIFIIFIINYNLLFSFLTITLCLVISFIKFSKKAKSAKVFSLKFIPIQLFELRSGLRTTFIYFLILYILSWLLIGFPIVTLVAIWILSSMIFGCYQHCESQEILQITHPNNFTLFKNKLYPVLRFISILIFPQLIIYGILNKEQFLIPIVEFVLILIVLIFTIVSKYAFYSPNEENSPIKIYLVLSQFSIIIPFLIPLPLVLTIIWYRKAIHNIYFYTHASN